MRLKPDAPPETGLRERNKRSTRERIRAAASALFARYGYESATMRQIAARAHVGLGTLFNYADDKRDLVFLIFNEELDALTGAALAAPRPGQPFVEQLLAVARCHYRHFSARPALSRILLQELTFYSSGKQAGAFHGIRRRLIDGVELLARAAQRERRIRADADAKIVARHFFFVYSAAIRWWIAAPRPDPRKGVADLRRLLELQVGGLAPAKARPGGIKRRRSGS